MPHTSDMEALLATSPQELGPNFTALPPPSGKAFPNTHVRLGFSILECAEKSLPDHVRQGSTVASEALEDGD